VVRARLIPADKVKVVYLGVPLEDFSRARSAAEVADARRDLGIGEGEFAIGTVTRLHESKGNSYLIDAAARVIAERPAARFYLVGEGPLLGVLEAQAASLGLGDRFVFAGFQKDVARTLSAFDLSVFPSLWEGTPITGFEALAMGKPIVSTDADGLLDILTADHDAIIVPKRDALALAAKIVWAIDRPSELMRLSAAARITGQRYDIAVFVRRMEQLYTLLHQVSRQTRRRGARDANLSFLESAAATSTTAAR